MHIIEERIYAVSPEGDLTVRSGEPLGIDLIESAELFEEPPHIMHVTGLKPTDFAVFFHLEASRRENQSHGYLVTAVNNVDEGIIVLGDAMELDPETWLNDRLANLMLLVGEEQVSEFNLSGLYQAVLARKKAV